MSEVLNPPVAAADLPHPDLQGEWKEFWAGAARGELLIQHCPACGAYQFYPRMICTSCGGEPQLKKASGRGRLYTYSVVRQNLVMPFKEMLPYVLAMVDLEEGVRMMTNVIGCTLDEIKIGMPLRVEFHKADEGFYVPYWRPE